MEDKSKEFECPICGHNEYDRKLSGPVMFGGRNSVEYCFCKKCSVIFMDPEKFTRTKKE